MTIDVNKIPITDVNSINHITQKTEFKGTTAPIPNDSVEISSKKKGLSNGAKWGIGIGTLAAVVGIGIAFVSKAHKNHKALVDNIEKLCDEKLVLSNLPEKIEWKAAKTLDEAMKFTKETLGIKEVDKNFTLEALNDTNACITDICNLHKGKLYMPTALEYTDSLKKNTLAAINGNIRSKNYGKMRINKRYFDRDFLIEDLKIDLYKDNIKKKFALSEDKYISNYERNGLVPYFDKNFTKYLDKYYSDPSKLSLDELRIISRTMEHMDDVLDRPKVCPMTLLKDLQSEFKKNGINVSIDELSKLSTKEQSKFLIDSLRKLGKNGQQKFIKVDIHLPDKTIYHEMGHLQDFGKNLKDALSKSYKDPNSNAIDNRFGNIQNDAKLKSLWEKDKEQFKKNYPDLYEFLTNQETQELAGRVSNYAKSGIGEFMADFYAQMATARKYGGTIAEDVEALYKKYNGTMI